ncbi:hydroxyethylthiazole kinase [Rhodobacter veldkampii DSM 11550]|uniref:Hydroxyethylthiazole kinase n=1 Tax=Phaeovulum veldkampii DSM 11550 TaxID=1185920 RepID=A0A2T4JHG3_9RHOB|nr:hydroxyethylthiazole kinase [Phaeovulum veldkampii]MBK5945563.1 hydroxyethylthiazole kinase [Phaeovulum veldkampii DSM 11550]NCU20650.1 hydroxyethylthiazole kinase [Candidatus Falkowbacteria bacterium]PTE17336.1 hydroxyethylthiazole kinase [Phaeovulum veldkampii DSM 11550]TDQ56325.1 hydroxyethylthiazole kinase [Phaeovulum veldkampii DSM 11550]
MRAELFLRLRAEKPLVLNITNFVAMNVAANVLLAAGASPAMACAPEEIADLTAISGALTVNFGTLNAEWVVAMRLAAEAANRAGRPWVFDPVAHQATPYRGTVVAQLLRLRPAIIRANASEIIALAGGQAGAAGPDAGDAVEAAEGAARDLALRLGAVVAVTGAVDFVTDGARACRIAGGSALMPQVTALGCSLTCLVGAFAAVAPGDPFEASVAALAAFAAAGAAAEVGASGPGSFGWRFLDELAALTPAAVAGACVVPA